MLSNTNLSSTDIALTLNSKNDQSKIVFGNATFNPKTKKALLDINLSVFELEDNEKFNIKTISLDGKHLDLNQKIKDLEFNLNEINNYLVSANLRNGGREKRNYQETIYLDLLIKTNDKNLINFFKKTDVNLIKRLDDNLSFKFIETKSGDMSWYGNGWNIQYCNLGDNYFSITVSITKDDVDALITKDGKYKLKNLALKDKKISIPKEIANKIFEFKFNEEPLNNLPQDKKEPWFVGSVSQLFSEYFGRYFRVMIKSCLDYDKQGFIDRDLEFTSLIGSGWEIAQALNNDFSVEFTKQNTNEKLVYKFSDKEKWFFIRRNISDNLLVIDFRPLLPKIRKEQQGIYYLTKISLKNYEIHIPDVITKIHLNFNEQHIDTEINQINVVDSNSSPQQVDLTLTFNPQKPFNYYFLENTIYDDPNKYKVKDKTFKEQFIKLKLTNVNDLNETWTIAPFAEEFKNFVSVTKESANGIDTKYKFSFDLSKLPKDKQKKYKITELIIGPEGIEPIILTKEVLDTEINLTVRAK
ncbi:hypothetical protein [Ureaplasma urealyticum]|uniref:hypothetical protein n=1 Tax=Ureaplasma urealyticum TaxID=2130 RepID=UPI0002D2FA1E|nr:hypothetical protein [Ureaplasma urealyticum]